MLSSDTSLPLISKSVKAFVSIVMIGVAYCRELSNSSLQEDPLNLQDLRYFVSVADHLHFGRAARECFVSQPTLSGQLRKLEQQLGVVLFERTNKRVALTSAGSRLLPHARKALQEVFTIQELAVELQDELRTPLRLGIIPTLAPYLMPRWLEPMRQACPAMPIELWEDTTEALLQLLRRHRLDALLIATHHHDNDLVERALFREPFLAALPPLHPLADRSQLSEEELRPDILVLAEGHCLATQALDACGYRETGVRQPPDGGSRPADLGHGGLRQGQLQAASLDTLLHLIAAGYGSTLVPALAADSIGQRNLVLCPLQGGASRTVRLVSRAGFPRQRALDAVALTVQEVVTDRCAVC